MHTYYIYLNSVIQALYTETQWYISFSSRFRQQYIYQLKKKTSKNPDLATIIRFIKQAHMTCNHSFPLVTTCCLQPPVAISKILTSRKHLPFQQVRVQPRHVRLSVHEHPTVWYGQENKGPDSSKNFKNYTYA